MAHAVDFSPLLCILQCPTEVVGTDLTREADWQKEEGAEGVGKGRTAAGGHEDSCRTACLWRKVERRYLKDQPCNSIPALKSKTFRKGASRVWWR